MKYVLFLFLCVDGCACSMLGIGPGLISMSPLRSIRRCIGSFLFCGGFFPFMSFVFVWLLFSSEIGFVMWSKCFVFLLCVFGILLVVCLYLVLYWYFFVVSFFSFLFWLRLVGRGLFR